MKWYNYKITMKITIMMFNFAIKQILIINFKIIYNDENLINEEEVYQKELKDLQIHLMLIEFY